MILDQTEPIILPCRPNVKICFYIGIIKHMYTMPKLEHITITPVGVDPDVVMNSFLKQSNKKEMFVPVISLQDAEKKRDQEILKYQKRLTMYPENKNIYTTNLERLNSQSTKDFVKNFYGYDDFDPKTEFFGYFGNPDSRLDSYDLGDEVFPLINNGLVNQAKKGDIDWERWRQKAHELAVWNAEQDRENQLGRTQLIAAREKVHSRPFSFIDRNGKWYQEDEMDEDVQKSVVLYQKEWERALLEASPDDVFTHWHFS